jgi:hypothetical protein
LISINDVGAINQRKPRPKMPEAVKAEKKIAIKKA